MSELYDALKARALAGGGSGGGFTPTTEQLAAMNSGITAEKVEKTDRIIMDSTEDTLLFVQATQPAGTIPEGSIWINTAVSSS